jgi:hypothetical protein
MPDTLRLLPERRKPCHEEGQTCAVNAWSKLSLGGAQKASWRVLGNSKYWYADEEMSDSALNDAIASYTETRPKVVISHTARPKPPVKF